MTSEDLVSAMRHLVADVLQVSVTRVLPETTPSQIEEWDSVRHLILMLALEERYGVIITPEIAAELRSATTLAAYVTSIKNRATS